MSLYLAHSSFLMVFMSSPSIVLSPTKKIKRKVGAKSSWSTATFFECGRFAAAAEESLQNPVPDCQCWSLKIATRTDSLLILMSRSLSYKWLRNLHNYLRRKNTPTLQSRSYITKASNAVLGSKLCCAALQPEERTKISVEDGLREACQNGNIAILSLMDQLKEFVVIICREYRNCLAKQIEITEVASNIGPESEKWDELPQYRILADELYNELNDYMTVFNTIGQMTDDESMKSFVNKEQLNLITAKYKILEAVLQKEFALNKEVELKLLVIKRDSILKGVN
ncbi:hypothetical protein NQ315_017081 [Exocentrus adspersus]|uniref:Uncharacterized protein n=1 Tax=Exocentrus adspersus TaxID=1586481 RepID=A0AAV8VHB2_9CUCU|nr:hypothetical protein NQ315_017081 [Exocentrus adspersus]